MKIFYCYSRPLRDFLSKNNQRVIVSTVHKKTNKTCWLFEGTEELNKYLDVWRLRKP